MRELAQGFDPDNLPCAARLGDFVAHHADSLVRARGGAWPNLLVPADAAVEPRIQGDREPLAHRSSAAVTGIDSRFEPVTVALEGESASALTVTLPARAAQAVVRDRREGDGRGGQDQLPVPAVRAGDHRRAVGGQRARAADEDAEEPRDHPRRVRLDEDRARRQEEPVGRRARDARPGARRGCRTISTSACECYGHRESSRLAEDLHRQRAARPDPQAGSEGRDRTAPARSSRRARRRSSTRRCRRRPTSRRSAAGR